MGTLPMPSDTALSAMGSAGAPEREVEAFAGEHLGGMRAELAESWVSRPGSPPVAATSTALPSSAPESTVRVARDEQLGGRVRRG